MTSGTPPVAAKRVLVSCEMYAHPTVAGADWEYQRCIQGAAARNGWTCRILVPGDIAAPSSDIVPTLPRIRADAPLLWQWYLNLWRLPRDISFACERTLQGGPSEFALGAQCLGGCAAFFGFAFAAIRLRRRRPYVLAIMRFPIAGRWTAPLYRAGDLLLRLFRIRVAYLTDTQALAASTGRCLRRAVSVLPIPHTEFGAGEMPGGHDDRVVCWWPGPPRVEKGLRIIQRLTQSPDASLPRLCLMAAASAGLMNQAGGMELRALPDPLSRSDYVKAMTDATVVLLPYDGEAYAERSSGIFVEAIVAGKIVLTSQGSWMSQELERHGLSQFVWDWEGDVPARIREAAREAIRDDAFAGIRNEYRSFHNLEAFARVLKAQW